MKSLLPFLVIFFGVATASCQRDQTPDSIVGDVFAGRPGSFVLVDCATGATSRFRPDSSSQRLAPCSTFKIWNAAIGFEEGLISSPDELFYTWDSTARAIPAWNRDLTMQEAFQASCVPAFQNLARRIGPARMQSWIDSLGYGDRDISAGAEVFWLPAEGRKTVLISPEEQAHLLCRLLSGKTPFSTTTVALLKGLMRSRETGRGTLYGKTGSGADETGTYVLGWYVGFVESKGKAYAFACTLKGTNVLGKDAREVVEAVLERLELL